MHDRFSLAISVMIGTITEKGRLGNLSREKLVRTDSKMLAEQLIHFAVVGFKQTGTST
tara:strand:- start:7183 stop:7356 length:174 start_codon:yes stop_codon:yes gene_type:complete